jgi:hypothetical protein
MDPNAGGAPAQTPQGGEQTPPAKDMPTGPAAGGTPPADPAPTGQEQPKYNFSDEFAPLAKKKGWVNEDKSLNADAVLKSYNNLEQLMVKDGKPVVKPAKSPQDDPESWNEYYKALGRPDSADGYKFSELPEGSAETSKEFDKWWMETAFETGIPADMADKVRLAYNKLQTEMLGKSSADAAEASQKEKNELLSEWGQKHEHNMHLAKLAANEFAPAEAIDALEKQLGYKAVMQMFAKIGENLGEDKFSGSTNGAVGLSPAEAKARLSEIKADKDYLNKENNLAPRS